MDNSKEEEREEKKEESQPAKHTGDFFSFVVAKHEKKDGYVITLSYKNPRTSRVVKKKFQVTVPPNFKDNGRKWNVPIVTGAALQYFSSLSKRDLVEERKTKREMGLGIYYILRRVTRRKGGDVLLSDFERIGKQYIAANNSGKLLPFNHQQDQEAAATEQPQGDEEHNKDPLSEKLGQEIATKVTPKPNQSIFVPEETGVTYAIIGKSFSGKTTFIVDQLNKLTEEQIREYNAIIFFTESAHAKPLSNLLPHVKAKMILIDRFCPIVLQALKRLNDASNLLFKFLVFFDDILALRGELVSKCILTLRNSNISTALSMQYEKMINPAQRSSIHNMYIFNLLSESWDYLLKGYMLGTMKELFPNTLMGVKTRTKVAQLLRENMNEYIIYYDQRRDQSYVWNKKEQR